jgi:rhodanese-related sulfurtransferase
MMKKIVFIILVITSLLMISCSPTNNKNAEENDNEGKVLMVSPEQAKKDLEENEEIILLDVRTLMEYESEHIKGAVLLPLDEIAEKANEVIPDKEEVYYVYCRSGNRSATAAQLLVDMGYENIYDLGGIIDWPYDTVKE